MGALLWATSTWATDLRVATYNASLNRAGPGLLLRDIRSGKDPQILNVIRILKEVRPDILLINEFDHDRDGVALIAFAEALAQGEDGLEYPYRFAGPSNTGQPSGLDLDDNGRTTDPQDAYGYGRFPGQYAMALLSRFPLDQTGLRTFRTLRWRDLPDAEMPQRADGTPFPSQEVHDTVRLSSKSHWDIPVLIDGAALHILAAHATPPVFDGPEDFNGLRNAAEIQFFINYLNGTSFEDDQGSDQAFGGQNAVVLGDLNADPVDGDGRHDAINALLSHPRLLDPKPRSDGGAAVPQTEANARHRGAPALDTADFRDDRGPGNLRVDYVLPTRTLTVRDAGVFWPAPGTEQAKLLGAGKSRASDHRLVWVDVTLP
ncbi:MAG: endonuclease/exonuclease/phosphatase family protein [Pseudomonadota bacterium]